MDPNYCLKYEYLLAIVNPSKNCNVKKVTFESGSMKKDHYWISVVRDQKYI